MKKRYLLIPSIIIIMIISTYFFIIKPFTWGDKSDLILTLSCNQNEMNINDSVEITYKLTNIGNNNLRILYPIGQRINLIDQNNNSIAWIGPDYPTPPDPTNKDLHKLKEGKNYSIIYTISFEHWKIQSNSTISIEGIYISGDQSKLWLPFWKGELYSNIIDIEIL